MTTNDTTNDTTKDQARMALYRKYLRTCEGMTQEQAREQTAKGCPFTVEQLNTAILKKSKLQASSNQREQPKEEPKRAKTIDDYLNVQQIVEINALINKGIRGNTLKMYIRDLYKIKDKAILQAIVDLLDIPVTRATRGDSLDDKFNRFCAEQVRTVEEMKAFIQENGTKNFIRFEAHLVSRGEFFNQVHAKYSK